MRLGVSDRSLSDDNVGFASVAYLSGMSGHQKMSELMRLRDQVRALLGQQTWMVDELSDKATKRELDFLAGHAAGQYCFRFVVSKMCELLRVSEQLADQIADESEDAESRTAAIKIRVASAEARRLGMRFNRGS